MDPVFWDMVNQTLKRARNTGRDPTEELDRAGLVLTPEHDKRIRLEAMNYLLIQVTNWRPAEFLRRSQGNASPADMYREIVQFIEEHIRWWETEQ